MNLKLFLSLFTAFFCLAAFSQETCSVQINKEKPSKLVTYLTENFGEDLAEGYLQKVRNYELLNGVKVLEQSEYNVVMDKMGILLGQANSQDQRLLIEERKNRYVLIKDIEEQLTQ